MILALHVMGKCEPKKRNWSGHRPLQNRNYPPGEPLKTRPRDAQWTLMETEEVVWPKALAAYRV
jgi:hypothetical protein